MHARNDQEEDGATSGGRREGGASRRSLITNMQGGRAGRTRTRTEGDPSDDEIISPFPALPYAIPGMDLGIGRSSSRFRGKGRAHSGEFAISYPRAKIFFGQNMKIHVYLGPVAIRMCWFLCCFTTEKKFQSWGVRAERSREGLRSAHLLGSCASGMAGGKILTHLPKTTGHAPSGHKTE